MLSYIYTPDFSPGGDPSGGSSNPADQIGLPNGYDAGNTSHSIITYPDYLGNTNLYSSPSPIILTYAESELLLADAAKRWAIGDAATHYNNGVLAAITELSAYGDAGAISDNDAQAYLDAHPYVDANGLEMINTQFWAATFFNEYEACSNWRRTS